MHVRCCGRGPEPSVVGEDVDVVSDVVVGRGEVLAPGEGSTSGEADACQVALACGTRDGQSEPCRGGGPVPAYSGVTLGRFVVERHGVDVAVDVPGPRKQTVYVVVGGDAVGDGQLGVTVVCATRKPLCIRQSGPVRAVNATTGETH